MNCSLHQFDGETIKSQIEKAQSFFEKEKLQERLGKLIGGVAIISVGGNSEIEIREKYEKMLKHTEDLDDMVQNPSKYSGITIENIQDNIKVREEQYKMNALIEWILK